MFDFGNANDAQKLAISSSNGAVLITAGPGTGKTFTLVQRAIYLIQECGVKPEQILMATFTEKAAKELVTRITNELAVRNIYVNVNEMYIGTFHSLCLRIIKDNLEVDTTGTELKRLARADYRIYQQHDDQALSLLDDIVATGNDVSRPHALFRQGEIAEKRKEYAQAEQLYLQIVEQHPDSYMADAALMRAALMEQNELKDKELAKQHYEKLIDDYPTSIYTAQAKKNYRKL